MFKFFKKPSPVELEQETIKKLSPKKIPNLKQLKYLSKFLTDKEKRTLRISFFFFFLSLALILTLFHFFHLKEIPMFGGEFREGIVGDPKPVLEHLIYEGLLKENENLELELGVAKSFNLSDDKKSIEFCLEKTFWHQGKELVLDDVIFNFKKATSKKIEGYTDLKIEKINDECLKIKSEVFLEDRLSLFTLSLKLEENSKLIGLGPYKIEKIESGSYSLKRNERYHRKGPWIEKIILKIYSDFPAAYAALEKKEIDALGFLPPKEVAKTLTGFNLYSPSLPYFTTLFFNLKKENPLKEKEIRQALSFLVPKEKIFKEVLFEEGKILNGSSDNKSEAQKILEKKESLPEISLTVVEGSGLFKTAEIIAEGWEEAGIKTKISTIKTPEINKIIKEGNFETLLLGVLEKNFDPYPLWHSSQIETGLNVSGFSNRKVDELLEKYKLTKDETKKKEYYKEFEKILNQEIPAVFLYTTNYIYLVDKKIKGVKIEKINYPEDRFNGISNWYLKTKRGIKK